ncbi:MAG: NepR family anti-sigma factor [Brevundimonas sp.]|uniref:anti-sigma T factor NepR n=1 Tax=Brevundimonas sp. TaxID=1871086 RepID=UPI0027324EA6|nr:NepR family anti-sigma factor [Brevundimonas sp.]MDP3403961.1 NepR family anti-sigma factor [Brevundimonas sp.]
MIDSPDSRKTPALPESGARETSLEEARLRQQAIGVKLRHLFDEVVNEPVPDAFLEILRRADQRKSGEDRT